jgi:hypothetical protein
MPQRTTRVATTRTAKWRASGWLPSLTRTPNGGQAARLAPSAANPDLRPLRTPTQRHAGGATPEARGTVTSALEGDLSDRLDEGVLLGVLSEVSNGDFSVRMPLNWTRVPGKIADRLNDVIAANQTLGGELARVSRDLLAQIPIGHGADHTLHLAGWAPEVTRVAREVGRPLLPCASATPADRRDQDRPIVRPEHAEHQW